jgi:nucleoid-associated protein EbfC
MFKEYGKFQNILKNAQGLQEKMLKVQQELEKKTTEGTSGGGMVTAIVNGKQEVVSLKIEPEVLASSDSTMLQDLIIAAVNQGIRSSREMMQQEISSATGNMGLNIPGLF